MEFPVKIRHRITLYLSIAFLLVLGVGGFSLYLAKSISGSVMEVMLQSKHVETTEAINTTIQHLLGELNRVMITGKLNKLEHINLLKEELNGYFEGFISRHDPASDAKELRLFDQIRVKAASTNLLAERLIQRAAQGLPPSLDDESMPDQMVHQLLSITKQLNNIHYAGINFELQRGQQKMLAINLIYLAFILVGAALVILANHFVSRRIVLPLNRLASATQEIAGGDLDKRVPVTSDDEIGSLSHAFNLMGGKLKAQDAREKMFQEELEETVKKRTKALEEANRYLNETQDNLIELEKLRVVGEMHASLTHEINNPLGIIVFKVKAILAEGKENGFPPELLSDLEEVTRQASRIAQVIHSLLTFTRRTPFESTKLNLNEVIQETIALIEQPFARARIVIEEELQPNLSYIQGDKNQIQQVLLNLLSNAKDALPQGGTISVETFQDGDGGPIMARVKDNGTGIASDDLSKIFEPFFTTKEVGKGTGLGLSVSYRIIKAHGGDIWAESQLDKGSTFTLSFKPTKKVQVIEET